MSRQGIKAGQAYVELGLDDHTGPDLDKAAKHLRAKATSISQTIKNLRAEDRKSGESALASVLNRGAGGITDTVASFLGVGVATMAVDFLARGLKTAAEEASRLKQEFKEGKIGVGDMAEGLLSTIPIFGQAWQAGRAIRELFTGEKADLEYINRQLKESVDLTAKIVNIRREGARQSNEASSSVRRVGADIANVGASEFDARLNSLAAAETDRLATRDERRKTAIEGTRKTYVDALIAAEKEYAEAYREFNTADGGDLEARRKRLANAEAVRDSIKDRQRAAGENAESAFDTNEGTGKNGGRLGELFSKQSAELERRRQEAYSKIVTDGIQETADMTSQARAEQLQREGKELEAQTLLIEHEGRKRIAAIYRSAQEQKKAIGATGFLDPRGMIIDAMSQSLVGGVMHGMNVKKETARLKNSDEEAGRVRELAQLRAAAIANVFDRERSEIDARYDYEFAVAKGNAEKIAHLKTAKAIEVANLERQHAEDQRRAEEGIDFQIEQQKTSNNKRGITRTLAMIELERQKALKEDADPRNAMSVGAAKINQLYDLRIEAARNEGQIARGTFSAVAAGRMGVGGGYVSEETAAAKETAKNTAAIKEGIDDLRTAVENGGAEFA